MIPLQRHTPLKEQSVIASTHIHTRTLHQPKHFLSSVYDTVSSDRCGRSGQLQENGMPNPKRA